MKKYLAHFLLLLGVSIQTSLLAGSFVIRGTVTDENKRPLAGKVLYITVESGDPGCNIQKKVQTNANGYYIDSVSCGGEIRFIQVQTTDCNGRTFLHRMVPGSTRVIESNFVLCGPPVPTSCNAVFRIVPSPTTATAFLYDFLSGDSRAASGDTIIARTWLFGDRTAPITGNEINVRHSFPGPGTYQVTLLIKTQKGCESRITNTLIVKETPCVVNSKIYIKRQLGLYFQFSSVEEKLSAGDSIVKRSWSFGDGSSMDGNEISPFKKYADTGIFRICLQFKTKYGCSGETCMDVRVKDGMSANTTCQSFFSVQSEGLTAWFNSERAIAGILPNGLPDTITSRSWFINDTLVPSTSPNMLVLRQMFQRPGTFRVKLVIKTRGGCESKLEESITLLNQNCNLSTKAVVVKNSGMEFLFERLVTNVNPGDSIISTIWKFGDGTSLEQGQGRTYKAYRQSGKYTVCVYTRTQRGCTSEACINIEAKNSITLPVECRAAFTYEVKDNKVFFNSSRSSASGGGMGAVADSIITRTWYFGSNTGGIEVPGNRDTIQYVFHQPGTYPVVLYIKTKSGCESKFLAHVVIAPKQCRFETKISVSRFSGLSYVFNSGISSPSGTDSITKRTWYFGDGTTLEGNVISPSKKYSSPGKYKVCLVSRTQRGCDSESCLEINATDTGVATTGCKANFVYQINGTVVYFNSSSSQGALTPTGSVQDSIISRTWFLGNPSSGPTFTGNEKEVKFDYLQAGTYTAYLTIKTRSGCESKYATTFTISTACKAVADYRFEQTGPNKIQFRSVASFASTGDSITQRIWSFGDNTMMVGNVVNPEKVYLKSGTYRACLQVKTGKGCVADVCKDIMVVDTSNLVGTFINYLKIVSINPNPVQSRMAVTVWSKMPNISTEFTIYDANGNPKMSSKKELAAGTNTLELYADRLNPGLYFLRVANAYGRESTQFYKQ